MDKRIWILLAGCLLIIAGVVMRIMHLPGGDAVSWAGRGMAIVYVIWWLATSTKKKKAE